MNFMCVAGAVPPYAAAFAEKNNIPVMGYDSVYLGYDVDFCFIDLIYFEDEPQTGKQQR